MVFLWFSRGFSCFFQGFHYVSLGKLVFLAYSVELDGLLEG